MPKRPRKHQVGQKAVEAFSAALPEEWVYRNIVPDYGIDAEIEIFDLIDAERNAAATGLTFKAQVKGTEISLGAGALSVPFRLETVSYFAALDVPVLLVRYHVPSRQLYVKWFHLVDFEMKRENQKTVTIRFGSEDLWRSDTWEQLRSQTEAFRDYTGLGLETPLTFRVLLTGEHLDDIKSELLFDMRETAKPFDDIVRFSGVEPAAEDARIDLRNDQMIIDYAGAGRIVFHLDAYQSSEEARTYFASDTLMLIGAWLSAAKYESLANRIFRTVALNARVTTTPGMVAQMSASFSRSHQFLEAARLAAQLEHREDMESFLASCFLLVPVIDHVFTQPEANEVEEALGSRARSNAESFGGLKAGRAAYDLGHFLRTQGRPMDAYPHYWDAVGWDASVLERGGFLREVASLLFLTRNYEHAVTFYEAALGAGEGGLTTALYADSLMFAGRYEDAEATFKSYLEHVPDSIDNAEWRLKLATLPMVQNFCGGHQQRRIREAEEIAVRTIRSNRRRFDSLLEALSLDGLCAPAWANLAVLEGRKNHKQDALVAWIAAALLYEDDPECWANAIILCADDIRKPVTAALAQNLLANGYRLCRDRLLRQLSEVIDAQAGPGASDEFLEILESELEDLGLK